MTAFLLPLNCDKTLLTHGSFKIHMRSHTGDKPYQCIKCDETFSKQGNLKSHLKAHSEEKP